jgi:hypothetical protein
MSKIKKLGIGIVAFEGTEHLKNITYELRDEVDVIAVCMQKVSYFGEPVDSIDVKEVERLKAEGYIDIITWYTPDLSYLTDGNKDPQHPRKLETIKRNEIIQTLEDAGCSHALITDSDEFYDRTDFRRAKKIINDDDNIKVTYVQYLNYYRDYQHYMVWPMEAWVPFITEIKYRFSFNNKEVDRASDPTRRYVISVYPGTRNYIFEWEVIKMHHFSWIRTNIEKKINSWSSKKVFDNYPTLHEAILQRYYNWEDGLNAIITLNVPNFSVVVNKLPKQYVHPKYFV